MAKRNLPASYKAKDSFDKNLKEWVSVFEKPNIVRSTKSHRSPLRRLPATPSDLQPIYGTNIQHQPVSKIMKNLRDVLVVPEAARGLSIFGLHSTWSPLLSATIDYCLFRFVPFCPAVVGSTRVFMSSDPDDPKNKPRHCSGNGPVEPSPFLLLCLLFHP